MMGEDEVATGGPRVEDLLLIILQYKGLDHSLAWVRGYQHSSLPGFIHVHVYLLDHSPNEKSGARPGVHLGREGKCSPLPESPPP